MAIAITPTILRKITRVIRDFLWHGRKDAKTGSCLATYPSRPWHHLQLPSDDVTAQFFRASTAWQLGDGTTCFFWTNHWLEGPSVAELAPSLFRFMPRCRRRRTTVCEGLTLRTWIGDIHGTLGPQEVIEYVGLWHKLHGATLTFKPERIIWRWTSNGV
ncbi:uncharacterized protein [Aegilops tauschii subsp. strangulata]|uniref:uncharacterized protein n=1 Tax=Aegilops tauschii subsp. strangulata TaxID=200361 RepID=UPI00098AD20C|nr:uncharacterized protein LOC109766968 [Aegilops tauschii subsp. strangulata]